MKKHYTPQKNSFLKTIFLSTLLIVGFSTAVFGQGTTCASAESLVVNGTCDTSASALDSTNDIGLPSCITAFTNEGWWVFSTSTLMDITIDATNGTTNRTLSISAYSGTCGGTLNEIGCINANGNGGDETLTLSSLSNGTYYVRVVFSNGNTSNTVSSICVSGTILCTEPTVTAATNVGSTSADINWTVASPAPSNGYEYVVSTSNTTPAGSGTSSTNTSESISGLVGSTTYYVFLRSNCGNGDYSSWAGPVSFTTSIAGDEPCDAIPLTVGTSCSTVTGTNVGATVSTISPNNLAGCGAHDGDEADVWYTTTVPANGAIQVDAFINSMTDPVIAIYTATSCSGPFTLLGCNDDGGVGFEALLQLSGLTAGETLYIRVWRYGGGSPGTFDICATTPSATPPSNDDCANATNLPCSTSDLAGTTSGATNTSPPSGVGCSSMSNYGVWYTFVGDGDLATITVIPDSGFDVELSISSGNCSGFTNIACVDNAFSGSLESYSFVTTNLTTYYIYIADAYSGATAFDTGDFTISRTCQTVSPPDNDDCAGAIDLVVNGSCVETAGTTLYATDSSGVADPSCGSYSGGDVWYTVTVPPTAELTLTTQTGSASDINMAVYSGTCGSLTQLSGTSCTTGSSLSLSGANGITPGQALYVRAWEAGNNDNGSFNICATASVPAGTNGVEICLGGNSEPMTTDLFCNVGGLSVIGQSDFSGSLDGSSSPHAYTIPWFMNPGDPCAFGTNYYAYDAIDFVCNVTGTYVFTASASWDTMGYIVEQGFTPGVCSASPAFIAGDDDTNGLLSEIVANLVAGQTYTLITTNALGGANLVGSYTWTTDLTPASAEWYTSATGGTPIAYGAFFDPIGNSSVISAGAPFSSLTDTNTPGTYSFWVACPGDATRTQVDYVILEEPTVTFTGSPGCNSFDVTINITQANVTQWTQVAYTTNGGSSYSWINAGNGNGILNSSDLPFTFTVYDTDVPDGSTLELFRIRWGTCIATYSSLSVSIPINYNCNCVTWDGDAADDNWNTNANWDTDMVPTLTDCVVIPSGYYPIVLNGTQDAEALSIAIASGASITVENEMTLTVQDFINGPGTVLLQGSPGASGTTNGSGNNPTSTSFDSSTTANLIQINDTATNTAVVTLQRHVFTRTQDYVYWSSPVTGIEPLTNFGTTNVFEWDPTIWTGDSNIQFGNWIAPLSSSMEAGKGYIARGPSGGSSTATNADWAIATFVGVPHNGTITQNLRRGTFSSDPDTSDNIEVQDDNWNLVGNPYPSNLDADAFLLENSQTNNRIDGYINFWTHGIQIWPGNSPNFGDFVLNYDITDYLTYNYTGGTSGGNGASFDGYIGSGQGFFVAMSEGAGTSVSANEYEIDIEFNNTMRTDQTEMFFRPSSQQGQKATNSLSGKHRIWLDLIQPDLTFQTMLVGYIPGATMDKDKMYDAKASSSKKIYSLITNEDETFVIQGRALPFEDTDIVSLGVVLDQVGEYAINLNNFDGLFETANQDIFLEDLELDIVHDLRESAYFFTVNEIGTFNNRFVLRYINNALSIDDMIKNDIRIMAPNNEYIKVISGTNQIEEIKVYDLLGRILINKQKINASEYVISNVPKTNGAYIVKTILANGMEKIQKVVLK